MNQLRTVIVDDEPLALEFLGLLLKDHDDIEIVAKCENGREAIDYLNNHDVDLLFLDVQMPSTDGFGVVEQIGISRMPPIVFVTAFNEHAIRAFDVQALDYLTKPVDAERLSRALARVREKLAAHAALITHKQLAAVVDELRSLNDGSKLAMPRFLVKDGDREVLISAERIDWIEAAQYYSCLHTNGRRYMLREPISELERRLDPRHFIRIHRSAIVNLDKIQEVYRDGAAESIAVLSDGQKLKMSKRGRERLIELGKASRS